MIITHYKAHELLDPSPILALGRKVWPMQVEKDFSFYCGDLYGQQALWVLAYEENQLIGMATCGEGDETIHVYNVGQDPEYPQDIIPQIMAYIYSLFPEHQPYGVVDKETAEHEEIHAKAGDFFAETETHKFYKLH